ncbi:MAG: translation initiation factor IF-1 [bacterium]|nr:translation initiation factor IF-1 [bacterium]
MTTSPDIPQVEGQVLENLPNTSFRVQLDDGQILLCHMAGKMRIHRIRLLPGDRVRLEHHGHLGRIIYKIK